MLSINPRHICCAALTKGHAQAHAKEDSASPQEVAAAAAAGAESPAAEEEPAAAAQTAAAAACGRLSSGRIEREVRRPGRDDHRVGTHLLTCGCRMDCHWPSPSAHLPIFGNWWPLVRRFNVTSLMYGAAQILRICCSNWRTVIHCMMGCREAPVPSAYMSASLAWGNWNLWDAKSYQQVCRRSLADSAEACRMHMTGILGSRPCVPALQKRLNVMHS